jgi:transposase
MEELTRFIALAQTERFTLTELCEQFGISRKTAYKHLERYATGGFKALATRTSRPLHSPARTDEAVTALILAERRLHRTWGPKKLRVVLETKHGITAPPACSTIAELLRRHGLSVRRRRRPGVYQADAHGCTKANQPNHVWTVDFKGWFTLGNGQRCDPLTVRDHYSHYVLCADALPNQQYKKTLSSTGHLWHDGHQYYVGEVYAGKHVALHHNSEGATELHFANLYLGNLIYNPEVARFRPPAYIERPPIPSTTPPTTSLDYQIYLDKVSPMSPDSL